MPAEVTSGNSPLPAPFRLLRVRLVAASSLSLLAGCAAIHVAISKRNLEVPTRMSDAVFLDPVGDDRRTAFICVRNAPDRPDFHIETPLKSAIAGRGYRIVNDPEEAHFKLQAQVPSVSRMSITEGEAALGAGYGGAIAGVAVGGVAGAATTGTGQGTAIGAVAGGIAETIANAAGKDVTRVAIADVQISEKAREAPSGAATSRSTPSKTRAAANNRCLPKRRRRSAAAPGSSARRTRSTFSARKQRRFLMKG